MVVNRNGDVRLELGALGRPEDSFVTSEGDRSTGVAMKVAGEGKVNPEAWSGPARSLISGSIALSTKNNFPSGPMTF